MHLGAFKVVSSLDLCLDRRYRKRMTGWNHYICDIPVVLVWTNLS